MAADRVVSVICKGGFMINFDYDLRNGKVNRIRVPVVLAMGNQDKNVRKLFSRLGVIWLRICYEGQCEKAESLQHRKAYKLKRVI